ncbi:MAG: HypC/HybG/HupF family hydrogenase formation chaperone [Acidimicrobiales bacterium]
MPVDEPGPSGPTERKASAALLTDSLSSDPFGVAPPSEAPAWSRDGADDADDLAAASLALARRFSGGATLWCIAPQWPEQARHVAVEFVHPVIVGSRALPAVHVGGPALVADLRSLVRPGDVLCAVSPADDPTVADVFRRAPAWGAMTMWIGAGHRPPGGAADHVLWSADVDGDPVLAPHDGSLSLRYHMLWELTHICFDHPGLLTEDPAVCEGPVCITCSDEGRLGEVVTTTGELDAEATVRTGDGLEVVDTMLVGPLQAGDLILIHAGSAITVLDNDLYPR